MEDQDVRWKIQAQRPQDFGKVEYVLRAWLASLQVLMGADQQQGLPSYYSILGVSSESSINEIKRAYRKLAMQWHPDRLTRTPSLLGEAKRKFQQIQEAYAVLSDHRKRTMYDAGLYDPEDQEDEGLSDFVQEILNLMAQDKRQERKKWWIRILLLIIITSVLKLWWKRVCKVYQHGGVVWKSSSQKPPCRD
eukprot:XP_024467183.1 uncharacterized protein LOC7459785 isoform X2 [Populus trichocarpa]